METLMGMLTPMLIVFGIFIAYALVCFIYHFYIKKLYRFYGFVKYNKLMESNLKIIQEYCKKNSEFLTIFNVLENAVRNPDLLEILSFREGESFSLRGEKYSISLIKTNSNINWFPKSVQSLSLNGYSLSALFLEESSNVLELLSFKEQMSLKFYCFEAFSKVFDCKNKLEETKRNIDKNKSLMKKKEEVRKFNSNKLYSLFKNRFYALEKK